MSIYRPTYLYIKQHSVTGKLYFGKTTSNPEKYDGSGLHWSHHIKLHGKEHVVTLWYCLFIDQESCTEFALNFSEQQNIVESDDWLNLKPENGLDGALIGNQNLKGKTFTIETRNKMSKSKLGNTIMVGRKLSDSTKKKMSEIKKGRTYTETTVLCPHCGKEGGQRNMTRYHFNNCKSLLPLTIDN